MNFDKQPYYQYLERGIEKRQPERVRMKHNKIVIGLLVRAKMNTGCKRECQKALEILSAEPEEMDSVGMIHRITGPFDAVKNDASVGIFSSSDTDNQGEDMKDAVRRIVTSTLLVCEEDGHFL